MAQPQTLSAPSQASAVGPAARADSSTYWKARIGELPDLRWAKVVDARRKLQRHQYDREAALEALLPPLANEMGVLMRRHAPIAGA